MRDRFKQAEEAVKKYIKENPEKVKRDLEEMGKQSKGPPFIGIPGEWEGSVGVELLSDLDYWRQRCQLAEMCLNASPCDTDITPRQIKAHNAYNKFISNFGDKLHNQHPVDKSAPH